MRIGEVAKRANIPASTLRYYERIGLIDPPQRKGGKRDYDEEILNILEIIQLGKNADFSLVDIRQLINVEDTDTALSSIWRKIAKQKIIEVEKTIKHYQEIHHTLMESIDCTCRGLKDCDLLTT